jgi:hypothetical protein
VLIAVVAALALFFGSAFVVQAASGCAGVAGLMFRLALRPGGTRRRR